MIITRGLGTGDLYLPDLGFEVNGDESGFSGDVAAGRRRRVVREVGDGRIRPVSAGGRRGAARPQPAAGCRGIDRRRTGAGTRAAAAGGETGSGGRRWACGPATARWWPGCHVAGSGWLGAAARTRPAGADMSGDGEGAGLGFGLREIRRGTHIYR